MKALFLSSIAAVGLFGASALASDLPTKAPVNKIPIIAPPYNWSGFYVGANFGAGWTTGSLNISDNNFYGGTTEFIGGVQAGYNFQAGHFLFGVEGDFDGASFNHPALPVPTLGSVSHRWMSTVAGRVGLVNDRWLVFAKLGGGWAHSDATVNVPGSPIWNGSSTNGGWLVGGGIEYGFKAHWTVKLEYDYLALSNWNSATVPVVGLGRDVQMIKAGINYKFESGLPAEAEVACRSSWRAFRRRRPAKGITEPDRGSGQRTVPEQHQFQLGTVQSHAGSTQHSASRADAPERKLERNLTHHHSIGKSARSAVKQQHQWRWRHYPIAVSVTGAPGQADLGRRPGLHRSVRK